MNAPIVTLVTAPTLWGSRSDFDSEGCAYPVPGRLKEKTREIRLRKLGHCTVG
jgi:hypothetical protein